MLQSEDLSVVVAGPVSRHTEPALAAVRRWLPGAQLILSTWRGTVPGGADADEVVESNDPGSPSGYNTNRMFRSARSGLAKATRRYALKLRTDAILTGTGFLDWWDFEPERSPAFTVFSRRLLTINVAVRPSNRPPGLLFHPSDCVQFGRTPDMQQLWAADELDELANAGHAVCGHGRTTPRLPRNTNEQALWISCLREAGHQVDYCCAVPSEKTSKFDSSMGIVNNFVVLEPWQFGVRLPKLEHEVLTLGAVSIRMWMSDWRRLQEHAVDATPSYRVLTSAGAS